MGLGRVYYSGRPHENGSTPRSLIERLQENPHDLEAGARFVYLYTSFVERLCRRAGRQPADVEEIANKVLFNAMHKLRTFEFRPGRRSFRPWLRSIARNECANWARRHQSAITTQSFIDEPDSASEEAALIEADWALFQAAYRRVREEWQGDPQAILAFEQSMVQNRKPAEVAQMLGVNAKFVHTATHRVRQRILQVLRESGALDDSNE